MSAVTEQQQDLALALKHLQAAEQLARVKRAQESLFYFCRYMMPDPSKPDDPDASLFVDKPHIRLLIEAIEKVERGEILRLAVSMPPQHGKSETCSRLFPAWAQGRKPWLNSMQGTYNQTYANDFGEKIRDYMLMPRFRQVFPRCILKSGSQAKDHLGIENGGQMIFLGRGGSGTGRPADRFLIDDPLKDSEEANSETIRAALWDWFTKVAYTRCHVGSSIIIIQTRWHEDDLIGRLCDPDHPNHNPEIASQWTYLNISALMEKKRPADVAMVKALGLTFNENGECALWPEKFSIPHLKTARTMNPQGFEALYQGRPSPDDGNYFVRDMIVPYKPEELPRNLRYYAASDHAVTEKQQNDATCMGVFGVDENDIIWVMPDLVWERMETDDTVEAMLDLMQRYRPQCWFMESEIVSKSFGPFLRRRMQEERIYTTIIPMPPAKDKRTRARAIQGRMGMKMVRFPVFAPWFSAAQNELLKFSNGTHDDFVDFMAWIGQGLDREVGAARTTPKATNVVRIGSIEWIKAAAARERREADLKKALGGF